MSEILYIQTTKSLNQFIETIVEESFVAVDTEFIRETTYWPILCLIQLATPKHAALIDPLAADIDLSSFFALMEKPNIIKVFHSARQDIEIFYNLNHKIPTPLFDTQIAALALGFRESIAYDQLVDQLLNRKIDKSMRRTNWQHRPLSAAQQAYALADVTHLCDLYARITEKLKAKNRQNWIKAETDKLLEQDLYTPLPEEAWKKVKHRLTKTQDLILLQKLAAWREKQAFAKNQPRGHILKDTLLNDLILMKPQTAKDFIKIKNFPKNLSRETMSIILDIFHSQHEEDPIIMPKVDKYRPMNNDQILAIDLLKLLLKFIAFKEQVAPRLIASTKDLELLVTLKDKAPLNQIKDWRHEIFGQKALKLLNGELSFLLDKDKVKLVEL